MFRASFALSVVASLLLGCGGDPEGSEVVDNWFQDVGVQPLDVVLVVDDSNSMADAQANLAAAVPTVVSTLAAEGVDYRFGVVTTDLTDPERRGRIVGPYVESTTANAAGVLAAQVQVGVDGAQLERGLGAGWAAVTPPLSDFENGGLRRDGARLAVVVLSDEDDCSDDGSERIDDPADCVSLPGELVSVEEYAGRFRALVDEPHEVALHALVETGVTAEFEGCGGLNVGTRYVQVSGLLGGLVLPHCTEATALGTELGLQLAGRRTRFPLSRQPDPQSITVVVAQDAAVGDDDDSAGGDAPGDEPLDGAAIPEDPTRAFGWTWDDASNTVRLWGEAVPPLGAAVQIRYLVATDG